MWPWWKHKAGLFERLLADGLIPDTLGRGFYSSGARQEARFGELPLLNPGRFWTAHEGFRAGDTGFARAENARGSASRIFTAAIPGAASAMERPCWSTPILMDVLASVGSARFFRCCDPRPGRWHTLPRRSPSSALKPILYALALDQGLIHPQSLRFVDRPEALRGIQS